MSLLNKLRPNHVGERLGHPPSVRRPEANLALSAPGPAGPAFAPRSARQSNALKEFLWQLEGIGRGCLLDLGPVWQATVSFFIERGFKVYTEDLLTAWKDFLRVEEQRLREAAPGAEADDMTPAARAQRFMSTNLQLADASVDAVLLWDLLDYVDAELAPRLVDRLARLVRDGGVVLAIFHGRAAEGFYRYRILDNQNLELMPAPPLFPVQHIFQNREIQNLFGRFRSSKTFVGRENLREAVFTR